MHKASRLLPLNYFVHRHAPLLRADVCGRNRRQFNHLNPIINATILGLDAGLRGLRDARRRHDPTRPLRHRDLRSLSASRNHAMFEPSLNRFPCSTGSSAPRPRPARTRTASSPCRSKRSASSDRRAHVHIFCPYRSHAERRRGFCLLMYISVHLANNAATKRAAGGEFRP